MPVLALHPEPYSEEVKTFFEGEGAVLETITIGRWRNGGWTVCSEHEEIAAFTNATDLLLWLANTIDRKAPEAVPCQHCGKRFTRGPGTGRNSNRIYCGDACRVGASRKRRPPIPKQD
jgi:hypothetical protein